MKFGKVYIRIDGADDELEKLADTLKARKARVAGDIETKPWGLRDLTVEDPDGVSIYLLADMSRCVSPHPSMLINSQNIIIFNQMVKGYQKPAKTVFEDASTAPS